MAQSISLAPYYRYFALVFLGVTGAVVAGSFAYETYIGPLPKGAGTGIWVAQILSASSATASRFVQMNRRSPTADEKEKLARASLVMAVTIGMLPLLALFSWLYVMAFAVADPEYQLAYYMYRQKALALSMSMGVGMWVLMASLFAFILAFSYLSFRRQYGGNAERLASRLPAER
ncbi:MAG TPA: ABZJ_00895 family protein [Sinorhizobium sp.]|nr:ABZJ_00895 family protein [Sinorhizobium sp.]